MTGMIATAIPAAMRPYSIAVAALSSLKNLITNRITLDRHSHRQITEGVPPTEAAPIGGHPIRAANAQSRRNHEALSPYRRKVENGLSPETGNYPAGGWNRLGNPNGLRTRYASQAEETDCPVRVIDVVSAMSAMSPLFSR